MAEAPYSKFTGSDIDAGDFFGKALAVDGAFLIVGAHIEEWGGYAYLHQYNTSTKLYEEKARFQGSDTVAADQFGTSVAIKVISQTNVLIAVGAPFAASGGVQRGAGYIFRWNGTAITQEKKAAPSESVDGDQVGGNGLAISETWMLVSSIARDAARGKVYEFSYVGGAWPETGSISPDEAAGEFGTSNSIHETHIAIGAPKAGANKGSIYIFTRNGVNSYTLEKKLDGTASWLGQSVSLRDTILVGGQLSNVKAYRRGPTWADWILQDTLTYVGATVDLGSWVDTSPSGESIIAGDRALDGNKGTAVIWSYVSNAWSQAYKLIPDDVGANDFHGYAVAIAFPTSSDEIAFSSSPWDDDAGADAGAVYAYDVDLPHPVVSEDVISEFPFSIYRMIIKSIREKEGGVLQKICQGFDDDKTGCLDELWERTLHDRTEQLHTLFEPDEVEAKWLPWLKSIVGFTRDLSFEATETELRKIIQRGVQFWSEKPSESAFVSAIRMVTGNRFKIRNYFDLRMQEGITYVTEELEDFDPNVLDFVSEIPNGVSLETCFATGDWPCTATFTIQDLPSVFTAVDQYLFLVITDHLDTPSNVGIYEIRQLNVGTNSGIIESVFPKQSVVDASWKLYGAMSEYLTELRIVDEPSGIGQVNRTLLKFLLNLPRAFSERIDIIYIDFLDEFITPADLDLWDLTGEVTVPPPGGAAVIGATQSMKTASSFGDDWGDQTTAFKIVGDSTSTKAYLRFFYQDTTNFYFVELDYGAQTLKLYKKVAAADTQLGSTATLSYIIPGQQDVVRVDALAVGTDTRIRVKVNGEKEIDALDSPAAFTKGRISIAAVGDTVRLKLAEVNTVPTTIERVGPNP